jgi:hypothetical protein
VKRIACSNQTPGILHLFRQFKFLNDLWIWQY